MTPKFHDLTVIDVRPETDDTISVAFAIPEELSADYSYKAGQYLTLRAMVNNEDIRRSYSICTAPNENEWRVAIKRIENGAFSSWAKESLKAGDRMQVMTPTGHFAFTPDPTVSQSYLLVAAGSGITPILSIVKTILTEEPLSDVTLVYGNKGFHSIIFREELEALKNKHLDRFRLIHVLSRESLGNALQKGRIDLDKVTKLNKAFFANQPIHGVYVCGPEEMIHAVKDGMMQAGIDEKNIHFELFATSTPIIKPAERVSNEPTVDSMVTIILDGDQLEIPLNSDGTSILDAAQAAGADLPFACKGGVCCTCKARILEGTARMDVNYALEKAEVDAGYILTCQSHPTSEKLIVSFDD
ncbi:MAG: phenylacetic acid degradation protein [Candidatus Fluviicola riflensis]|nr:MAG: phenylacetic acid degradation protein [Candidatus Fluviicola riflensis]OGS76494.1 MAG: phenylacetic acid degradation protein [Candidatus Fluviicola riflensis]OGS82788.1 MAG: phenylacetic acid degradation protein [Fluviicola sp. RIFCSPHIGHO2_01_FULL_43_53]OGS89087.1 MAG: phenylacetic acid degradation protein [Fluviicola sp. RIFCSPHIGHO2_12_FULL_43_24]